MRPFRFREGTPNEYSRLTDESLSGYLERTRARCLEFPILM